MILSAHSSARARRRSSRSVSWKYTCDVRQAARPERRARGHAERVRGRQLEQRLPRRGEVDAGSTSASRGASGAQVRRAEGGRRAVGVAELGQHGGHALVHVPAAAAEEPRLEPALAQPRAFVPHARRPGRRRSGAPARGPPQCVWMAERPVRGRVARAGEPERLALARVGSGGRIERGDREARRAVAPGGRQKRRQASVVERPFDVAGDDGTDDRTTAYSPWLDAPCAGSADSSPVGRRPTRRSSSG